MALILTNPILLHTNSLCVYCTCVLSFSTSSAHDIYVAHAVAEQRVDLRQSSETCNPLVEVNSIEVVAR